MVEGQTKAHGGGMTSVPFAGPPLAHVDPPIRDQHDAARLFAPILQHQREVLAFAYFDPKWRLLGSRSTRG
jgi:hypothetical protein